MNKQNDEQILDDYIQNTLLSAIKPLQDQHEKIGLFDYAGRVVFITDDLLEAFSIKDRSVVMGKRITEIEPSDEVKELLEISEHQLKNYLIEYQNIVMRVIQQRHSIRAASICQWFGTVTIVESIFLPLFASQEQVAGVLEIDYPTSNFTARDFLLSSTPCNQTNHHGLNIKPLSPRQQEVLFLILNGYSEYDVASLLNISRSTVKSIISYQLLDKFAVDNREDLIRQASMMGYKNIPPRKLFAWKFIIL